MVVSMVKPKWILQGPSPKALHEFTLSSGKKSIGRGVAFSPVRNHLGRAEQSCQGNQTEHVV
jgi:hypothetical protein